MHHPAIALTTALLLTGVLAPAQAQVQKMRPGLWEHSVAMKSQSGEMEAAMAQMQKSMASMTPAQRKQMEQMLAQQGVAMGPGGSTTTVKVCISPEQADLDRIPPLHDRKKVMAAVKDYAKMLQADSIVENFYAKLGTMGMADVQNHMGGLPVRNFSAGRLADTGAGERFKLGADYIGPLNTSRGGEQTHACMPGCVIQCSNVYHDANGKELVSPVEYETLGLLGSNCGLTEPDDLAQLNFICNDLGVDTIETGAMLAVLMEAGLGAFGDARFMADCLGEVARGTANGRIWAQGTARVGAHYGVRRTPVIKRQAISAYDPRVVEATGITMMVTAQGADHTAGNLPRLKTREMDVESLMSQSLLQQTRVAANDSLGLCIFGQSVTNPNVDFLVTALNAAHGTSLTPDFFEALGRDTLRLEAEFNRRAGFTERDDELPAFFYEEPLPPTNQTARFHAGDVHRIYERLTT